jgi:hypothetical protein
MSFYILLLMIFISFLKPCFLQLLIGYFCVFFVQIINAHQCRVNPFATLNQNNKLKIFIVKILNFYNK